MFSSFHKMLYNIICLLNTKPSLFKWRQSVTSEWSYGETRRLSESSALLMLLAADRCLTDSVAAHIVTILCPNELQSHMSALSAPNIPISPEFSHWDSESHFHLSTLVLCGAVGLSHSTACESDEKQQYAEQCDEKCQYLMFPKRPPPLKICCWIINQV